MRILFIGDIVGEAALDFTLSKLPALKKFYNIDFVAANGENAAKDGIGIMPSQAEAMLLMGVDVITTGNHYGGKKQIFSCADDKKPILFPANCGEGYGGSIAFDMGRQSVGVINLLGNTFINGDHKSPFMVADEETAKLKRACNIIIVDFHAEATSEKAALAHYLDGRVTALLGTHTHVQTADERILKNGTAFISDVGMTGPVDSILGMDIEIATNRFLKEEKERHRVAESKIKLCAVLIDADEKSGKANSIERICIE